MFGILNCLVITTIGGEKTFTREFDIIITASAGTFDRLVKDICVYRYTHGTCVSIVFINTIQDTLKDTAVLRPFCDNSRKKIV